MPILSTNARYTGRLPTFGAGLFLYGGNMPTQETRLFEGTPAQFAEVVTLFADQLRQAGQEAPYVLRPSPMRPDPGEVLCIFGPGDPWYAVGLITAVRASKGKTGLTVDAEALAWPAIKCWWSLLRDHLDAGGWLYRGVDQPSGRNASRDAEIYRLRTEEHWTVQRLANKYNEGKTNRIYQILRAEKQKRKV